MEELVHGGAVRRLVAAVDPPGPAVGREQHVPCELERVGLEVARELDPQQLARVEGQGAVRRCPRGCSLAGACSYVWLFLVASLATLAGEGVKGFDTRDSSHGTRLGSPTSSQVFPRTRRAGTSRPTERRQRTTARLHLRLQPLPPAGVGEGSGTRQLHAVPACQPLQEGVTASGPGVAGRHGSVRGDNFRMRSDTNGHEDGESAAGC